MHRNLGDAIALLQREPETRHYAIALRTAIQFDSRPEASDVAVNDETASCRAVRFLDSIGASAAAGILRQAEGRDHASSACARSVAQNNAGLTPRQFEVLRLLAKGLTNGGIARQLQTSLKTVEHHVGAILAALDAHNRTTAAYVARQRNLI